MGLRREPRADNSQSRGSPPATPLTCYSSPFSGLSSVFKFKKNNNNKTPSLFLALILNSKWWRSGERWIEPTFVSLYPQFLNLSFTAHDMVRNLIF